MKQYTIIETTEQRYDPDTRKEEPVTIYRTPCGQTIPKIKIEYDWSEVQKNMDGINDKEPKRTRKTLTSEDIIRDHCENCIECKIIMGYSKQRTLTSQQVANLFGVGIDDKKTSTGNLESSYGILTHYSTIAAIRTLQNVVIANREDFSGGWAKVVTPRNTKHCIDLTTLNRFGGTYDEHLRNIQVLDDDDNAVLFKLEERYFINGSDEHGRYISEQSKPSATLNEAYENLKPEAAHVAESQGLKVLRQGELFFIPIHEAKPENVQRRTRTQATRIRFKCQKCGIHANKRYEQVIPNETDTETLKQKLADALQNWQEMTPNDEYTQEQIDTRKIEITKGIAELETGKPTSEPLIINRIDNDVASHPYIHGYFSRNKNITEKQKNCEGNDKDMQRSETQGFQYSTYPSIAGHETHTATETSQHNGLIVVRGIIRHAQHDHSPLKLGNVWHSVHPNTQKQGVSVQRGNRD